MSEDLNIDQLQEITRTKFDEGYRLVQIGCTTISTEQFEMNYSFNRVDQFINYQTKISKEVSIPSISNIYPNAFLYENEIHDLFGIQFPGLAIDFNGHFYKTAIPNPFRGDQK